MLAQDYADVQARLAEIEAKLMAWHRGNECSRRLAKIPGIGPIGASLLVMKTPDPKAFESGRTSPPGSGCTPKDHSTAGKAQARRHHARRRRGAAQRRWWPAPWR